MNGKENVGTNEVVQPTTPGDPKPGARPRKPRGPGAAITAASQADQIASSTASSYSTIEKAASGAAPSSSSKIVAVDASNDVADKDAQNAMASLAQDTPCTVEKQVDAKTSSAAIGEEEDEFADLEEATKGGDDDGMYGDTLDSAWLIGLKGVKLIREAESLIACILLRRNNPSQPALWHSFVGDLVPADAVHTASEGRIYGDNSSSSTESYDENGEVTDKKVEPIVPVVRTIEELKALWKQQHEKPLRADVLSAICMRFGPAYIDLQNKIKVATESEFKSDRSMLRKAAYDAFNAKHIIPTLSLNTTIDIRFIVNWLKETEMTLELIELQIARSNHILEKTMSELVKDNIGSSDVFTEICKKIGIPGIHGKLVRALCGSAMIKAGLSPDMPCPIEILQSYCIYRSQMSPTSTADNDDNNNHNEGASCASIFSTKSQLNALLRPKSFEATRLQEVLMEGSNTVNRGTNDNNDEDILIDDVRSRAPMIKHILSIIKDMKKNSNGKVSKKVLKNEIVKYYKHFSHEFVEILLKLWYNNNNYYDDHNIMISTDVIETFICPNEKKMMAIRIRTPMQFSFKVHCKCVYPTEIIYQTTIKSIFAKLKTLSEL